MNKALTDMLFARQMRILSPETRLKANKLSLTQTIRFEGILKQLTPELTSIVMKRIRRYDIGSKGSF